MTWRGWGKALETTFFDTISKIIFARLNPNIIVQYGFNCSLPT